MTCIHNQVNTKPKHRPLHFCNFHALKFLKQCLKSHRVTPAWTVWNAVRPEHQLLTVSVTHAMMLPASPEHSQNTLGVGSCRDTVLTLMCSGHMHIEFARNHSGLLWDPVRMFSDRVVLEISLYTAWLCQLLGDT